MSDIRIVRPTDHQGYFRLWNDIQGEIPWNDPLDTLLAKVGADEFERRSRRFISTARELFRRDLYAIMRFGLSHGDRIHENMGCRWLDQPWLFDKVRKVDRLCREGRLHRMWLYWARGHWKTSTLQGLCVQRILIKPDIRINYYSRTEPMARARAGGIRLELETNVLLHLLYPEILWGPEPKDAGAEDWSDRSLTVRRESMGRAAEAMSESTLECFGINAVATGGHPNINVVDDSVDDTNAHSVNMVNKTARQMGAIIPASDPSAVEHRQDWFVGTDYSRRSAYKVGREQGIIRSVWHESAVDFKRYGQMDQRTFDLQLEAGEIEGVLLTNDELKEYRGKGPQAWTRFCLQYLTRLDMVGKKTLDAGKLTVYTSRPEAIADKANIYATSDPGGFPGMSQQQQLSDSAIGIWGLCPDGMIRLLDGILDQMGAAERMRWLLNAVRRWSRWGHFIEARLEEGGTGGDVSTCCEIQQHQNYVFPVVRVSRGGGPGAQKKIDRIHDRVGPLLDKLVVPQRLVRPRHNEDEDLIQFMKDGLNDFPESDSNALDWMDMVALLAEPVEKQIMEFRGGREPESRPIGPLIWPKAGDWCPRQKSPTIGDLHPKHRSVLGLFGAANIRVRDIRRSRRGVGIEL